MNSFVHAGHKRSRLRRRLALAVAVTGVGLVAAGCGGDGSGAGPGAAAAGTGANGLPDLSGQTISYLGFGGPVDEAFKKTVFADFEKATGAKIVTDSVTDYAKIENQVKSGNVQYNLVDGDPYVIDPGCGKIWGALKIDASAVPQALKPKSSCSAPDYQYFYVLAHDRTAVPGRPHTCKDFFDTKTYPGKRGVDSYYVTGLWECAAIAAGADPVNPYPLDIDAAANELKSIKKELVVEDTDATTIDDMENHDVAMVLTSAGTVAKALKAGAPFSVSHDWFVRAYGAYGIPKGAPQAGAAEALINYLLRPDVNAKWLTVVDGAAGNVTEPIKVKAPRNVLTDDMSKGLLLNWTWWAENKDRVAQLWSEIATG